MCDFCKSRGPTFRRAYKQIGGLRALTKAPFMALTGSAPPATAAEILRSLSITQPVVVMRRLNRENIYLSISKKQAIAVSQTMYM